MTFCVAQATLGLRKQTQPGKVHRWSSQTLLCVAVKTCQFGMNFRYAHETLPRSNVSSYPTSVTSISWELSWSKKLAKAGPSVDTNASVAHIQQNQLASRTRCTGCVLRAYHHTVVCGRGITQSYAGSNTVYCPCTTELLPTYDIRQNKRA